jgi:hypothetical protein
MKKLILLSGIVICCLSANSQSGKNINTQLSSSGSTQYFATSNISGPTNVHGGEQHDYIITDLPFGSTVTWQVLGDAAIVTASSSAVTLYFNTSPAGGGSNGVVTLKATVSDGVNPAITKILKLFPTYCTVCP